MKELLMLFAVVITLAVGIDLLPIMGSPQKLAVVENVVGGSVGDSASPRKRLPKHRLNKGQLKKCIGCLSLTKHKI